MTQEEFENIAPSLRDLMYSVAHDFFGNQDDAEDVAQDGMLELWKFRERMDVRSVSHRGLAVRIAKHCCINLVRKRRSTEELSLDEAKLAPPGADTASSPHEELELAEMKEAIDRALQHLNPSERRLFQLRQIEGLGIDEIATMTNITPASVRSMVSAARRKIFNELKQRQRL